MKSWVLISLCFIFAFSDMYAVEDEKKNEITEKQEKESSAQTLEKEKESTVQAVNNEGLVENEQGYNLKLRTLEEKINSLKDKIFRSKQRLAILQETVLSGTIAGSRATIIHKNDVGNTFKLISAIYYLDDAPIFRKIDVPEELDKKEIVVFDGSIVPGPHHLSVFYVFAGKGFSVFSYMKGYSFKMKAGHSFNVEEGNLVEIIASPKDKGASHNIDNRLYTYFNVIKKMFEEKTENQEQEK